MSDKTISRVPDVDEVPPPEAVAITALEDATEDEANRQGSWAYTFGLPPENNPYAEYAEEFEWWYAGYWAAADDDEGRKDKPHE